MSMRLSLLAASATLLFASAAFGTPLSKSLSSAQQKMSTCSHAAKGKSGADYKNAVSSCLKGGGADAAAKPTTQQRMSSCAKQAAGKKGADYKSAVSACLKAH